MTRRLGFGLLVGVLLTTAAADAQLGGLIRRAGGTITKTPPQPGQQPNSSPVSASTLGCAVDDAEMDRLLKALEAQRAERDAALKEAAAAKTRAQHEACMEQVALSPEFDKILASFDPADMAKADAAAKALIQAKCGPPPDEVPRQLESRFNAAAKLLSDCDARIEEHAYRFCQLTPSVQASAENGGLQVPGTGSSVFWVYTGAEAKAYAPRCAQLMSLMDARAAQDRQLEAIRGQ
jgi:hypothetical protein